MDTGGDIVEAMLDPRFPKPCAILFAAIAVATGTSTSVNALAERGACDRSTVVRQLAELRALGIITSTRGNHCLTITINPRDQWTVNGAVSVVGSPSSVLAPSPDIFPDLPEISSAQPTASVAVPPCVGTVLPTADASLSETLQILQSCSFWRDGFTLMDLLGLRVEFPEANFPSLAHKFVRKYGKSQRAWPKQWAGTKVPNWPGRFARHIEYHTEAKTGGPSSKRVPSPKRDWRTATEDDRDVVRTEVTALLKLRGKNDKAIADGLDEYAARYYEGRPL